MKGPESGCVGGGSTAGEIPARWECREFGRDDAGRPSSETDLERSLDEGAQHHASQVEVAAKEQNSPCSSEDAQLENEGAQVEGGHVETAVPERNSSRLSEGTQLKAEDAQVETAGAGTNSPHVSDGAQLETEGAHVAELEARPPQNIYAVLVEALEEAC